MISKRRANTYSNLIRRIILMTKISSKDILMKMESIMVLTKMKNCSRKMKNCFKDWPRLFQRISQVLLMILVMMSLMIHKALLIFQMETQAHQLKMLKSRKWFKRSLMVMTLLSYKNQSLTNIIHQRPQEYWQWKLAPKRFHTNHGLEERIMKLNLDKNLSLKLNVIFLRHWFINRKRRH